MMLADKYKRICKQLFALQLFLTWLTVVFSTIASCAQFEDTRTVVFSVRVASLPPIMKQAIFCVSVLVTVLLSIDGLFSARSRWKLLRSSACKLQSIIWQYRTRVGRFTVNENRASMNEAEKALTLALAQWRDECVASANVKSTDFARQHPESVYKHFQNSGMLAEGSDDFHSPVQPGQYIPLRIESAIAFYQKRIPVYGAFGRNLKIFVLMLGLCSALLAHFEYAEQVALVAALNTIMTSWMEFSDYFNKIERYTSTVISLRKLLDWWDSMSEVEKASSATVSRMIQLSESIISEELSSWTAVSETQSRDKGKGKDEKKDRSEQKGGQNEVRVWGESALK